MSFAFKTNNSIIVDNNSFFIGTTGFSTNIYSSEVGIVTASDGATSDEFGRSVAVGNGRIVVGAFNKDGGSNADQGSAYIFDLNGNQLGIITASNGADSDNFGISVAAGSGRIVVGAYRHDTFNGTQAGSAYIYDLDGNQLGIITASDGVSGDNFGWSVAAGSGRIVVGAVGNDDNGNASGSAYIYDLNGNEVGILTASDGAFGDFFGFSVAVGCGRIVVSSPFNDDNGNQSGSAYIFDLNGNQLGIITASDNAAGDEFGTSVAVGNGRIVVGARYDDGGSNLNQGSAYIFDLDGNQLGIITASDGAANDYFGYSVAAGSGKIVVGAPFDNVGSNNDQGSAYIYDTPKQTHFLDQLDGR
jgi:co-chaperonin GroES (HSP10)